MATLGQAGELHPTGVWGEATHHPTLHRFVHGHLRISRAHGEFHDRHVEVRGIPSALLGPPAPRRRSERLCLSSQDAAVPVVDDRGEALTSQTPETGLPVSDAEGGNVLGHRMSERVPCRFRHIALDVRQVLQRCQELGELAAIALGLQLADHDVPQPRRSFVFREDERPATVLPAGVIDGIAIT